MKRAFVNGKIFTSDPDANYAQAMVVEDGKITWIGNDSDLPEKIEDVTDLGGKRVLPGLVDSHVHGILLAELNRQISCLPPKVYSIEDMVDSIRRVRAEQGPGEWIRGWGYDEGKLAEHRSPTRYDLDRGCSDSPVAIMRICAHVNCVNSKALELAGITKDTPDPPTGKILRDENGEPTGILTEGARNLLKDVLPIADEETVLSQMRELGDLLLSQGITAITDMGLLDERDPYTIYKDAERDGFLQKVRIYYMWEHFMKNPDFTIPTEHMRKDQQIQVAGLKLIGDGSVSGKTAWMREPFLNSGDNCGSPVCTDEEVETAIAFCKKHHCQLSIHAMGERAIDRIVDRVSKEGDWLKDGTPSLRVEHVTEPSDRAVRQVIENHFGFVTQPIFLYCEIESYLNNLGLERSQKTYPIRDLLNKGVRICFSTDAPATSWAVPSDPFPNIKASVTRKAWDGTDIGQDQRVDVKTAIELYTRESANIAGFEGIGQLKKGYSADFIVLDRDILEIPSEQIDEVRVDQTYIAGERKYERREA